jgi:hypothetical protein
LIHDLETEVVAIDDLKEGELPSKLRGMSKSELTDLLKAQAQKRKDLQKEIEDLAKKRQSFIEEKVKAERNKGTQSLDAKIYDCIRTQAAAKDILYKEGPKY